MNDIEKTQSCITQVTQQEPYLTGEHVIIAVLDSGIDYFLQNFAMHLGRRGFWQSGIRHSSLMRSREKCRHQGIRRAYYIQEK